MTIETRQARTWTIWPNSSLSDRGMLAVLTLFVVWFALLSIFGLVSGLWLLLPFAGIELLAVVWAIRWMRRRQRAWQRIVVEDEQIAVTDRQDGRYNTASFPLAWARLRREPSHRIGAERQTRLLLGCSGRFVEIGQCLTERERGELYRALSSLWASSEHQLVNA